MSQNTITPFAESVTAIVVSSTNVIEVGVKDEVGRNLKTEADVAFWFSSVMFRIAAREMSNPKTGEERQRKIKRLFGWKF